MSSWPIKPLPSTHGFPVDNASAPIDNPPTPPEPGNTPATRSPVESAASPVEGGKIPPTLNEPTPLPVPITGADVDPVVLPTRVSEPALFVMDGSDLFSPQVGGRPRQVGDYEILAELGRGGMGVVYKAVHHKLKRIVALKMILAGSHAGRDVLARFRLEAEAIARLRHPHIVQIFEIGEDDGKPYFALEFVDGGSLSRFSGTPQPPRQAAEMVAVLAQAMHAAHQAGIVHRDLKPGNVLLTVRGDQLPAPVGTAGRLPLAAFEPKITDFGLAKRLDAKEQLSKSGAIMGTPSFMSPEQAEGSLRNIGPLSDVYSLAAILYDLLTGRPPFLGESVVATLVQVRHQEPVPPSRLQPNVPRDLEIICLKGLRKDVRQRYGSAQALADDLHRFLNGQPILARPAPVWERAWKWMKRRPGAAALVAVTVLAVCSVVTAVTLHAHNQSQEARLYRQELNRVKEQEGARDRSASTLLQAQRYEANGKWNEAYTELARAQEALDAQPDLPAVDLRAEVKQRMMVIRERLLEQEQRQQAAGRRQRFQTPYDRALFHQMLFTGLTAAESRANTRVAARDALAIYGLVSEEMQSPAEPSLLDLDRSHLDAEEHKKMVIGCYELLLIWADAEVDPVPGPGDAGEPNRRSIEKALSLLARAEALGRTHGLETRTYHFQKARCVALSRGEKFDQTRIDKGAPAALTGPLDWFLESVQRYRAGQFAVASHASREVLRQQADHFWARYLLALCHLRVGKWIDAKAELTVCINQKPGFIWPRLMRGLASTEWGYAHRTEPLGEAEFRSAEEDIDASLKDKDRLVQYVGLNQRGVLNIRRRRWEAAVGDLRQALAENPNGVHACINLANALQESGKLTEAVAALDQAIKLAPNLTDLYESRASLHLHRKQRPAARDDFQRAIQTLERGNGDGQPDRLVKNLVELGRILHHERGYTAALECFDRVLGLKPDHLLTQRLRAETLVALHREAEAATALDSYLSRTQDVPAEVYQLRGLIHALTGKLPAAIDMYTLALRQNPKDDETRCQRGWAYLMTDATRLALVDFEACLQSDPANAEARLGRANVRIRLRERDAALEDAAAAEKQGPLTEHLLYNLARIYAQAAGQLEAEAGQAPRRPEQFAAYLRWTEYTEKAIDCLSRALTEVPEPERASYWHKQIAADPAFTAVRQRPWYRLMAERFAPKVP